MLLFEEKWVSCTGGWWREGGLTCCGNREEDNSEDELGDACIAQDIEDLCRDGSRWFEVGGC